MEPNGTKRNIQPKKPAERQPSLREQANARMREASVKKKSASAENRVTSSSERNPQKPKQTVSVDRNTQKPGQSSPAQKPRQTSSSERPRKTIQNTPEDARRERQSATIKRERPAARDAVRTERASSARNNSRAKKKSSPIFWIGLALYTILLLILAGGFLLYTDKCLAKYEKSQSEHYMAEYMDTFEEKIRNGSFTEADFNFGEIDMSFVNTSSITEDYLASLKNVSEFSFEKDASSYLTEAPIYNILGDGNPVARVSLKSIDQTKIFAILTIMDWDIDSISPICSIEVSDITFKIPETFTPVIEGKVVDASYLTGEKSSIPEYANVSEYVAMPDYVEYKVSNVLEDSEINVLDANGNPVNFSRNGNSIYALYAPNEGTLTEERKAEALQMVQTYEDIMTDDLGGGDHGFSKVAAFLIKDSYYYNYVKQWTTGVDITFTSAHRFDDPKYSNIIVDNYVEYADNCYSLHVAFTKNMVYTKREGKCRNEFDSTVFFVNYDDTDDGIDNPHWCIVDIIATTNN